jgi:hypothetical protein
MDKPLPLNRPVAISLGNGKEVECKLSCSSTATPGRFSRGLQLTITTPRNSPLHEYVKPLIGQHIDGIYYVSPEGGGDVLSLYVDVLPIATPTVAKIGKRTPVSCSVRWAVFERDGFRCCGCGAKGGEKNAHGYIVKLEVDHKRSVADGGTNDDENLQSLCFECNRGKGKRSMVA